MTKLIAVILLLANCQVLFCAVHKTPEIVISIVISIVIARCTTNASVTEPVYRIYQTDKRTLKRNVRPSIISRSEWGANAPKSTLRNLAEEPAPFVIIHHSASDSCTTRAICQARVRSFQNYHMNQKGWKDIGYNFLVGEDGNIYEGRGWGKHGAHSTPYNSKSIGICMIGNFVGHNPSAAAIKAVKDLIEYGVTLGKIQENYTLLGHRQTTSTSCPGDSLYQLIQTWPHWSSI